MKKKRAFNLKSIFILLLLLCLYIFICAFSYVDAVSHELSQNIFRLHVIANSDNSVDQNLKYIVRDKVLAYMNDISKDCSSKAEIISVINDNIDNFECIARQTILENGFSYDVSVSVGNFEFPTKSYGDITLPKGFYDALRIEIGDAIGQNWWCVMFPPLCFVDVSTGVVPEASKDVMQDNLSQESFSIISENNTDTEVSFKFKIIEWLQDVKVLTAKN